MEISEKKQLSAKQTRILKLALDAVMLILLVLMYKAQVISIAFHEIGGLALIGLFVIHHLVNAKWTGAVTRRIFANKTPGIVRARYIVDVLLLVAFLTIGITGVLISKVVFSLHVQGNYKTLHYFSAALAVLLMGVHLGLHADYIFGKLLRKGANRIAKIALCVVLAAMIAFGGYSLFSTSFIRYLTAPLQAASFSHGEFQPNGDIELDGSSGNLPKDISELPEFQDNGAQPPQDPSGAPGSGSGDMFQGGAPGSLEGRGENHSEGGSASALLLIVQYMSIITLFAAVTYGIVLLAGKRKKPASDPELGEIIYVEPEKEESSSGEAEA